MSWIPEETYNIFCEVQALYKKALNAIPNRAQELYKEVTRLRFYYIII